MIIDSVAIARIANTYLSVRLYEIVSRLAVGMSTKEIGVELHISPKTVETYREQLKKRFEVQTAAELIVCAVHWKLQEQANVVLQSGNSIAGKVCT